MRLTSIEKRARRQLDLLTPREREVITLLAEGLKAPAVAAELRVARNTARVHVQNILRKLGVHSQLEAAVWVLRQGVSSDLPSERRGSDGSRGTRPRANRPRAA